MENESYTNDQSSGLDKFSKAGDSHLMIREKENQIFNKYREGKYSEIVPDGMVCENEYQIVPVKIEFVLKEVNGKGVGDLRDFLLKGGREQTWENVTRWAGAIFSAKIEEWEAVDNISKSEKQKRREETLSKIIAVNCKKTPGKGKANESEIKHFVKDNKNILIEQFNLYSPDYIILCGTREYYDIIYPNLNWKTTLRGIPYASQERISESGDYSIVIDFVHPVARIGGNFLYYMLIDAIREIQAREK